MARELKVSIAGVIDGNGDIDLLPSSTLRKGTALSAPGVEVKESKGDGDDEEDEEEEEGNEERRGTK